MSVESKTAQKNTGRTTKRKLMNMRKSVGNKNIKMMKSIERKNEKRI